MLFMHAFAVDDGERTFLERMGILSASFPQGAKYALRWKIHVLGGNDLPARLSCVNALYRLGASQCHFNT